MLNHSPVKITAIGKYLPAELMDNAYFERLVDTSDDWIIKRSGIRRRFRAAENEFASDLAIGAVEDLIKKGADINGVDLIITAVFAPDHITPSVSSLVAGRFGLDAGTFDVHSACSGFVSALLTANAYLSSGMAKKALVISAETLTKLTDYTDRNTCVLFGDAASAALVERSDKPRFFAADFGSDGSQADKIYCSYISDSINGVKLEKKGLIVQNGRAVYEYVVKIISAKITDFIDRAGLKISDIDHFIPHSANMRMLEEMCKRTGFSEEKLLSSVEDYGNTSSATIPLALAAALDEGKVKRGDKILMYGFGAGLAYAGAIFEW